MLPKSVVVVGADAMFAESLIARLQSAAVSLRRHHDGAELLADPDAFGHGFYVLGGRAADGSDRALHAEQGAKDLIRTLRERTEAGVLALLAPGDIDAFANAVDAGADMGLFTPVTPEHTLLVMRALHGRIERQKVSLLRWTLDAAAGLLHAPDGARVRLSPADVTLMQCFVDAAGAVVTRNTLVRRLGLAETPTLDNTLHATLYRLRRRIERASTSLVPLQNEPRLGYVFRAPLTPR